MSIRKYLSVSAVMITAALLATQVSAQDINVLRGSKLPDHAMWLDTLDLSKISQGWCLAHAGKSVMGNPITIKSIVYERGIGTHTESRIEVDLKGAALKFESVIGLDDEERGKGTASFEVFVDGVEKFDSGLMKAGEEKLVSIDLTGAKHMRLNVKDGGDGIINDHADWAGAMLVLDPNAKQQPVMSTIPVEPAIPMASGVSPKPAIHGPRIVGTTPGRDFIFLIPATGDGPLTFEAKNLPAGLKLDSNTGIISGSLQKEGEHIVELTVKGARGVANRKLKIVGGDHKLVLTPPMGWNSWNVWGGAVDAAKVRAAADAMIKSGLAAHGFQYVNIDDTWEGETRDSSGEILSNAKFGDMNLLSGYVHSKGLKLGIYSSPGPMTCGGYLGSYQHEYQDANTWAKWGIDYVKYDWCSYGSIDKDTNPEELKKPYILMQDALSKCGRDIVYSVCEYGFGDVWKWGAEVGANCWRTCTDINDSWDAINSTAFKQDGNEKYAGPGHWNDTDMLVVGKVGLGPQLHPSKLAPNEQVLHITMWSLLSSPLLIGCDMTDMDKLTLDLLTNDEVLDVNQDPLGKPAGRRSKDGDFEVWARPLWDGTTAVGLFNIGSVKAKVTAKWSDLGISGKQVVRDIWQKKDLGEFDESFTATVPSHGAIMIKIGTPDRTDW